MKIINHLISGQVLILLVGLSAGCAKNGPWRTAEIRACDSVASCEGSYIEKHGDYDLAFVEFSERGNLFSPEKTEEILDYIQRKSDDGGVGVIVFAHGWKHNAESDDANVIDFRSALGKVKKHFDSYPQHLVGVYVGWRGKTLQIPLLQEATYWDRKAVAEEVGKGGITDLFLKLENIYKSESSNMLVIVGHSFGGALTVSALNEVFLSRLSNVESTGSQLDTFGSGVIALNPAIEANQLVQLKEKSMALGQHEVCEDSSENNCKQVDYPTMLHVISSKGDKATNIVFPIGQFFGTVLKWNEVELERNYQTSNGLKKYEISEVDMDITTIGNYKYFHTSSIFQSKQNSIDDTNSPSQLGNWEYKSYCEESSDEHFPCSDSEPVSFLITGKSFISGHNDIFNLNVISYISAAISKSFSEKKIPGEAFSGVAPEAYSECLENDVFSFNKCFKYHYRCYNLNEN